MLLERSSFGKEDVLVLWVSWRNRHGYVILKAFNSGAAYLRFSRWWWWGLGISGKQCGKQGSLQRFISSVSQESLGWCLISHGRPRITPAVESSRTRNLIFSWCRIPTVRVISPDWCLMDERLRGFPVTDYNINFCSMDSFLMLNCWHSREEMKFPADPESRRADTTREKLR